MEKVKSIVKKAINIDVEAYLIGKENFNNPIKEIEALAEKRLIDSCFSCIHFKEEPIDFLKIIDDKIPELSNMMCGDCGCTSAYKLRQSKKVCKLW